MEMIAALSHMDDGNGGNDDDYDSRRPTPLDPEYWRGITHSLEPSQPMHAPSIGGADAVAFVQSHPYASGFHTASYAYPAVGAYGGGGGAILHHAPTQRPMTAPSIGIGNGNGSAFGHYGYDGGGVYATSPIHYQDTRTLPVSPVVLAEPFYSGRVELRHPMATSMDWGYMAPQSGILSSPPQALKAELRDAFVRAQCFADLRSLFRSYDTAMSGSIPLHAIQDAFAMVGVIVPSQVIHTIGQHFGQHGGGMVDYSALVRFLEVDPQEWYVSRRRFAFII
jgi:hypothetical protein